MKNQNAAWEVFIEDNKKNMKAKNILINFLILFGLSSCGMTTLSKNDSRFNPILGKEIYTKRSLFLYDISPDLNGDSSRFTISGAKRGPEKVVAVLGVGHPVVFDAVKSSRELGSYYQHLVGYTNVNSKRYPIIYYIGMGGDGWKVGFNNYFSSPPQ